MATIFAYVPSDGEANYSTFANPDQRLQQSGFTATGVIVDATSPNGQTIPVDPATGLRPEVYVRNGPGDLNAACIGNPPPNMTVLQLLENSIARVIPNQVWTRSQLTLQDIQAWLQQPGNPARTVFALFQP